MIDMGIVHGGEAQAQPIVVGKTTVYVHTDIEPVETDDGHAEYQYHEIQYTKDEYIKLFAEQTPKKLEDQQAQIDYIAMMTDVDFDV